MNLQKLIPKKKYSYRAYLHMLFKLLPRGAAWKFSCAPQSPTWVSLPTFLGDEFEDMLFSEYLYIDFTDAFSIKYVNDKKIAIQDLDTLTYKRFSPTIEGDYQLEFGIMLLIDGNYCRVKIQAGGVVGEIGWNASGGGNLVIKDSGGFVVEAISCPFTLYKEISFRIIRSNNSVSFQYKLNLLWHSFSTSFASSGSTYFESITGINYSGFSYFWMQSTSGLPEINYIQESNFEKLLSVFADELCRFETEIMKLLRETIPGLSYESLEDWETTLGLPDEGTPTDPTIEQRQQYAHIKYTQGKGDLPAGEVFIQNKAYYIQYAASLGITITIDWGSYGTVWRWTTKMYGTLQRVTHMPTGDIDGARFGSLNSPFIWYVTVVSDPQGNRSIIEAVFNKVKPAHTQVIFLP